MVTWGVHRCPLQVVGCRQELTWLAEHRSDVIAKLNRDFNKPWFRWKKNDSVVEDIAEMTYKEVVLRMVRLLHVAQRE